MAHWDARRYAAVSTPQQSWGEEVATRLFLRGNERIVDLGCGAGQITALLADRVPDGAVIGVDASSDMLAEAHRRLGSRATLVLADLREWTPPPSTDVLFSTASLHWVPNHLALWARQAAGLRPRARVHVQYGGYGNLPGVVEAMGAVAASGSFRAYLHPFVTPWTFHTPDEATEQLEAGGCHDVVAWTEHRVAAPSDLPSFVGVSVVGGELAKLPRRLRADYLDAVLSSLGRPAALEYVRLNVTAVR